ncbi:Chromate resistance protein ChrB [Actinopolymorpha alba]|uniref:Chromate resistance protein ChrB n=1 Tax=Actinopolymorpha alba TaxID=533267 RepID=UPI000382736B|nr:Chromate resistance protein ChrB [Actinopolymorpha alba]
MRWVVIVVRLAAEPSRHRVAVWRELRRAGAVSLAPGVWALPATPAFLPVVERARALAERGGGELLALDVTGRDEPSGAALVAAYTDAREAEWAEFVSDCAKFEAELAKEERLGKLTLAELEEEEQSLERLRRWFRDLKVRDVLALPSAISAEQRLKDCAERLEAYANRVYQAAHGFPESQREERP